jgi:fibronectin-binding autotransporter adhesin
LSSQNALQNSTLTMNGGALVFDSAVSGNAFTLGGLAAGASGAGYDLALLNNAGTPAAIALTVGGNNATTIYGGNLSGTGASLTKTGNGTLTLSNATYTGNTTVGLGYLDITGGTFGSSSNTFSVQGNSTTVQTAGATVSGGTLNAGQVNIGNAAGGQYAATMTINGNANATFATGVTVGASGNTAGGLAINTSGSVSLGAAAEARDDGTPGLSIQGGTVTATSVDVQGAGTATAANANMSISGGSLTISGSSGAFIVGDATAGTGHGGNLNMTGGMLTYLGTDGLLAAHNTGATTPHGNVTISGGIANLTGVTLNAGNITGATSTLTITNGATLYLGSVGLVVGTGGTNTSATFGKGTIGALADWSSSAPIILANTTTFQAADSGATAHNISLSGAISGSGSLTKTGNGTLTLSGTNSYINGTTVSNGVLNINGINALGGINYGGLTLNGTELQYAVGSTGNGSLDLTSIGTAGVTIGSGANIIDVDGNNVSYGNAIGNYGTGGLTVQSTTAGGVLNLNGTNTYTGSTTVASGAALGGSGVISNAVEIQSGGILAPGNSGVGTNTAGALTLDSGAVINTEFNGTGHDQTVVTGTLTINDSSDNAAFNLYSEGGTLPWTTIGSYTLIQYTGSNPSLDSTWTTVSSTNPHVGNPQPSLTYAFSASSGKLTLTIGLSGNTVAGLWTNTAASGSWATAANWDSNPKVPHAAGDLATFGNGTSLTTVTLDGSKSLGVFTFNNANSYQINQGTGGTLTMDNNGAGAVINVTGGTANQINTPLALNDNVTLAAQSGKSLAVSGNIANGTAGTKALTVNSPGTLALSGNNTYGPSAGSTGTTLSGGAILQVDSNNALALGDVNVPDNGTLQAGVAGLSLGNNINTSSGANVTVDTSGNNLTLNGTVEGSGNLTKIGNGTLTISTGNSYTGTTTVNGGVLSISGEFSVGNSASLILNGGDLFGSTDVSLDPPIGIGPISGSVPGTALLDAATGHGLYVFGAITSAGNTGANNLIVNSGAGNGGTVLLENNSTFNGTTVISNGWLDVMTPLSLQNSTVNYNNQGGLLVFDGNNNVTVATLGGLSGGQNLGLTNLSGIGVALTVGSNNTSTTYSGNLNDAGLGGALDEGWNRHVHSHRHQ